MKRLVTCCVLILGLSAHSGLAASTETTMRCESEQALSGKASRGADLELVLDAQGRVAGLTASSYFANGVEGGTTLCDFELPTGEDRVRFEERGQVTLIHVTDPDAGPVELRLARTKRGYRLDLLDVPGYYCGAGAVFPASIEIEPRRRECRLVWAKP